MIPLEAMDDLEEALDADGMTMLGRALLCLVVVVALSPVIVWWLS